MAVPLSNMHARRKKGIDLWNLNSALFRNYYHQFYLSDLYEGTEYKSRTQKSSQMLLQNSLHMKNSITKAEGGFVSHRPSHHGIIFQEAEHHSVPVFSSYLETVTVHKKHYSAYAHSVVVSVM